MEGDFLEDRSPPRRRGWPAEQRLPRTTLQTKKVYQGKIRAAAKIILHIIPMLVVPAEFCVSGLIFGTVGNQFSGA
ncbi:MAG: hypothetical protein WC517_02415 [Patescibacteria group bacterium]